MTTYLEYYGFDYFFTRKLPLIDLDDEENSDTIDEALSLYREDVDLSNFSLRRAFSTILAELMEDGDFTQEEALEILAEEDYVVSVTTALYYSVDAGDSDVEYLSTLIRKRAQRLMRQTARNRP